MKNIFKYASLLLSAVMLISCQGQSGDEQDGPDGPDGPVTGKVLELTGDKAYVQTFGGDYVTLTVTLDGQPVTEGVTFYDAKGKVLALDGFKFSTTKEGEYSIWASYGTFQTETIVIRAVSVEIPETPADSKPASTSFKTRILLNEFTTVGCTACPTMKKVLHEALEDESMKEMLVMTECHTGLVNSVPDPAYVRTEFDDFCATTGYPFVKVDMYYGFDNGARYTAAALKTDLKEMRDAKMDVAAGIAVNSSVKDGKLVAKVTMKSAADGAYRIGAMLLEDGIYGKQLGGGAEPWMDTHDGCVRYIDSYYSASGSPRYYGHSVGDVAKGKTADYIFVWDLDKIWEEGTKYGEMYGNVKWDARVDENLHMAVFVSTIGKNDKGEEYYYVNNVIDVRNLNGKTPFEYR